MGFKSYIVTGSSGIAAATIKLLTRDGNSVFFIGREEVSCKSLLCELNKTGLTADYIAGDLVDENVIKRLVSSCNTKHGRIDGLFNVAGLAVEILEMVLYTNVTLEGWRQH
jgi:NADP-dependent 3-hydroxy acid dehydrogenase YdfG